MTPSNIKHFIHLTEILQTLCLMEQPCCTCATGYMDMDHCRFGANPWVMQDFLLKSVDFTQRPMGLVARLLLPNSSDLSELSDSVIYIIIWHALMHSPFAFKNKTTYNDKRPLWLHANSQPPASCLPCRTSHYMKKQQCLMWAPCDSSCHMESTYYNPLP